MQCPCRRSSAPGSADQHFGETRIPLVEETVAIEKRAVTTGRVQVRTFVDEEQVRVAEALNREIVDVERVPIGRQVEVAPTVREEGEFLIVPVIEERLVIEKRLFLVEELRLRRTTVTVPVEADATRRVMRAEVTRENIAEGENG